MVCTGDKHPIKIKVLRIISRKGKISEFKGESIREIKKK